MNIEKLNPGDIIKNYRVLCEILGEAIKGGGNSKQIQLKNFKRYFDWKKSGQKFIITAVYDKPLAKEDRRHLGNNTGHYHAGDNTYEVSNRLSKKRGVYKIQLDNDVYIGSTTVSFRERYTQHYRNIGGFMPYTQQLLLEGGKYSILWIASDDFSEQEIRDMERCYINQYANDGKYNLVNKQKYIVIKERTKHE